MLIRPKHQPTAAPVRSGSASAEDATLLALAAPTLLRRLAPTDARRRNRLRCRAVELADDGALDVEWDTFATGPISVAGREADNAAGEARERVRHPEWYRFLDPSAPNHAIKKLEADLYLARIDPWLATLDPDARVIDLGGGSGRLAIPLAERGLRVTLADASPAALADAAHALGTTAIDVELGLAAADDAGKLDRDSFDAALSIEVLCYLEEPLRGARELARLVRPGGLAFVSVEAWPGGLLAVPDLGPGELASAMREHTIHRPDDLFVRYFDRDELVRMLSSAGLETLELVSHHHVLEGPWRSVLEQLDLGRADHRDQVAALETRVSDDPTLSTFGRGWLAIARKP